MLIKKLSDTSYMLHNVFVYNRRSNIQPTGLDIAFEWGMINEIYLTISKAIYKMREDYKINSNKLNYLNSELVVDGLNRDDSDCFIDNLVYKFYELRVISEENDDFTNWFKQIVYNNDLSTQVANVQYNSWTVSIKNSEFTFAKAQLMLMLLSLFQTVTIENWNISEFSKKNNFIQSKWMKSKTKKLILNSVDINVDGKIFILSEDNDNSSVEESKSYSNEASTLYSLLLNQIVSILYLIRIIKGIISIFIIYKIKIWSINQNIWFSVWDKAGQIVFFWIIK